MNKISPWKPRLRLVSGRWYAFAPNNSREAMCGLSRGISICRSMNLAAEKAREVNP